MRDETGIVWVADDDSGDAFGTAIGMKGIGYFLSSACENTTRGRGSFLLYIFLRYLAVDRVLYAPRQSD